MLRVLLACVRLLIDRNQPHEAHQASYAMTATLVIVALHMTGHLARPARLGQDCTPGFARTGPRASLPPCFPSRPSVSSDEPTHSRGHRLKRPSVYKFYMISISLRSSIAGCSGLDLLTRVANAYEVPLAGMYSWKIEKGLSTSRRSRIPKF